MKPPFLILALPRSRTKWLSEFLSYPPKRVGHDVAAESSSIPDYLDRITQYDGTCDTGAVIGWKLIRRFIPETKIVAVYRPLREIKASFAKLGFKPVDGELESRSAMLDELALDPSIFTVSFSDLDSPRTCKEIFEYCLGLPFDRSWYEKFAKRNIQVDFPARMAFLAGRQKEIAHFKNDVRRALAELEPACAV